MKKTVLVVDDEKEIVQLLSMRLVNNGYDVLKAYNGREALNIAKKEKPDLIVLDILMPEMDGSKVASLLKEDPDTEDIPVIFLTCLFTKNDEKEGNVRGGTYFIAKPYDGEQLLKLIKENVR